MSAGGGGGGGGGVASTVQLRTAGLGSTLPAASVALTRGCGRRPRGPNRTAASHRSPRSPESSLHWKLEPASLELKVKVADRLSVLAGGAASMDVSGGWCRPAAGRKVGSREPSRCNPARPRAPTSGCCDRGTSGHGAQLVQGSATWPRRPRGPPQVRRSGRGGPRIPRTRPGVRTPEPEPSFPWTFGRGVRRGMPPAGLRRAATDQGHAEDQDGEQSCRRLRRPYIAALAACPMLSSASVRGSLILSRTLTGLADGLALKEMRYAAEAGDSPQNYGSPDLRICSGDSAATRHPNKSADVM